MNKNNSLSYLITVSQKHLLPAQMLIDSLSKKTKNKITVVGNLDQEGISLIEAYGVRYIDEDSIDYKGRLPQVNWTEKYRSFGWYKQMFIRLCIDTFMDTDQVVILDSEVFVFENWDESKLYDEKTGNPRCFFWVPKKRKSDWDYQMYRGAAYLLSFLPECEGIMEYANSTEYRRHISGVVLFSTQNVKKLWTTLEARTDLQTNISNLFNSEDDLAFSDHDIYGLAVEYGLFEDTVPTTMHDNLLGWYENHEDPNFHKFKKSAMWSMCQNYASYITPEEYLQYMNTIATKLNKKVTKNSQYWNVADRELINTKFDNEEGIEYFFKYFSQLNHTFRSRFLTMFEALRLLKEFSKKPVIVEVGTLRDSNKGGGHSTYKFGEYCKRYGGHLYTVDISSDAIKFSRKASKDFQPWISYHEQDSSRFLRDFDGMIDLLYLDGFDSTPGMEKEASKKQLEEIKTALPKLSEKCIVLLDDADLPMGGKTGYSASYLQNNGFKLVINSYQQLYVRDKPKLSRGLIGSIKQKIRQ